jgi:hypothetical protein
MLPALQCHSNFDSSPFCPVHCAEMTGLYCVVSCRVLISTLAGKRVVPSYGNYRILSRENSVDSRVQVAIVPELNLQTTRVTLESAGRGMLLSLGYCTLFPNIVGPVSPLHRLADFASDGGEVLDWAPQASKAAHATVAKQATSDLQNLRGVSRTSSSPHPSTSIGRRSLGLHWPCHTIRRCNRVMKAARPAHRHQLCETIPARGLSKHLALIEPITGVSLLVS